MHATRKKKLPTIAQKLPILEIIKHNADMINKIHPVKLIFLLLIFFNFILFFRKVTKLSYGLKIDFF